MKLVRDTWLVFVRQMALVLRNPVWLIVGVMQPLYFLLLFGPLLKGVAMVMVSVVDVHSANCATVPLTVTVSTEVPA